MQWFQKNLLLLSYTTKIKAAGSSKILAFKRQGQSVTFQKDLAWAFTAVKFGISGEEIGTVGRIVGNLLAVALYPVAISWQ
jgi:hypothetical protein